jgi:nucleotide-binding universal stress UspA family protein
MKRIIAAVDFSPVSNAVVVQAVAIARAFEAELYLVHVAAPDPDFVGFEAGPRSVRETRAGELRKEHRDLQQWASDLRDQGLEAEALLVQGPTVETLTERAAHLRADLVVLGSHGHGAVYRALMGSVSEGVLREGICPVLVIPARDEESDASK